MDCSLKSFDKSFKKHFYSLGNQIATTPGHFILFPLIVTVVLSFGVLYFKFEDDVDFQYAPSNGQGWSERDDFETYFTEETSTSFHPSRGTRLGRFVRVIITAKDGGSLLRVKIWKDIMELNGRVTSTYIISEGRVYTYKDLCAIWNEECWKNNIFDLNNLMSKIESRDLNLTYPVMMDPNTYDTFVFPFHFGGVNLSTGGIISSIKALSVNFYLRSSVTSDFERSYKWEKAIIQLLQDIKFPTIEVSPFASHTLGDELYVTSFSVLPFIAVSAVVILVFMITSNMLMDWVRAKPYLGVLSVLSAFMASATSFGLLMFFGVPFVSINVTIPILMLGIGNDDTFVILAAWRKTRIQDSVQKRLAETYSDAAVSITITSLTDVVSFYMGVFTPFPFVQIYCGFAGTAVLINYLYHITFFGGCLAVAGYAEKKQMHSIFCHPVKSKSDSESDNVCYSLWCAGGISEKDPSNSKDNQDNFFMMFFRDYLAALLCKPITKGLVIMVYIAYLAGAIYGCITLEKGLDWEVTATHNSYSVGFYRKNDHYFRKYPYRIQVMITGDVLYSDEATQEKLLALHKSLEALPFIASSLYTESWIRGWLGFVKRYKNRIGLNITDEETFIEALRNYNKIWPATLQTVSVTALFMILIAAIFIPYPLCCLLVSFSIISIEIGVVGYMSLWGIKLDTVSLGFIIMSIGFSVDFSAHISYSYLISKSKTPHEKISETLFKLGVPILFGAVSTNLSVLPVGFSSTYSFIVAFKIVTMCMAFGVFHGIILLPVVLSLFEYYFERWKVVPKFQGA